MISLKNKIGADKILSVYWFAILFIIAAGILAMVYVFYNSPFDVRQIEAEILSSRVAECISHQGILDSKWVSGNAENSNSLTEIQGTIGTCQTEQECQKIIGTKLVFIVSSVKNDLGIQNIDESVKQEGVAENFECLVLQIATQESSLHHCTNFKDENNNPLYCDSNIDGVFKSSGDEISYGVMQINIGPNAHKGKVNPENFEEGIIYGVEKVLIQQYKENKAGKLFEPTNKVYSEWKAAIRGYNGWGLNGDNSYVENVIARREFIQNTFPEFCSQNAIVEPTLGNLETECSLDFGSEFDDEQFYVQVDFYDLKKFQYENRDGKKIITSGHLKTISDGNQNLKADCEIQKNDDFEKQAKCSEGSFYSIDENNNLYVIVISSAVRKTEKNART